MREVKTTFPPLPPFATPLIYILQEKFWNKNFFLVLSELSQSSILCISFMLQNYLMLLHLHMYRPFNFI